jgi:membrane fusion protein (multidrug efflux system)
MVVRQQLIRTGRARGDFISVESGLKPGDHIVSAGLFKLRNGSTVTESAQDAPKATEKPKPADT